MTTVVNLPVDVPDQLFVNGAWIDGTEERSTVLDPATGSSLGTVANAGVADLDHALTAASEALPAWAKASPRARGEVLHRAFESMTARADEIAMLISREMGKTLADARAEVIFAAEWFRWFAEEAVRVGGELRTAPSGTNRILTVRKPVGVTLSVTPWNFPAAMATRKIGPALAAGCTVVLKPAEETPFTVLFVTKLLAEAGLPAGVVNVVPTDQPARLVSAALADSRVRKLSFTGSTAVGRLLLGQAADRVLNSSMELGGNAPFIVLDDADLDAAVDGAMIAKMRNGGQACTAANRFIVQRSVVKTFTDKLTERMAALRTGPGTADGTDLGPMVSARAVDGIAALVDAAVADGARVRLGGVRPDRPGFFYPPTVLTDVPVGSPIAGEEIFGPVAPIFAVDDDAQAVAFANATEMGLTGYVYSGDLARGLRVSEALEVGMVGLNRGMVSDAAAPFGGVRQSGIGREGGFEGNDEYLETSYIAASW